MADVGYRRLESLIEEGASVGALTEEVARQPPAERADLWRYVWGLCDGHYDADQESAIWLQAWGQSEGSGALRRVPG